MKKIRMLGEPPILAIQLSPDEVTVLVATCGELASVSAEATSADVRVGATGALLARTVSGDGEAVAVASDAQVRTVSGDIRIEAACGRVIAESTSGDVAVHAQRAVAVEAHTVSGDIRVTADPGIPPAVTARSISGRVRTS